MDLQEMLTHDFISLVPMPPQLPVSTLVCPPTEAFEAAFKLPDVNSMHGGISPIGMHQAASQAHLPTTAKRPTGLMSTQSPTNFNKVFTGMNGVDGKPTLRPATTV